MTKYDGEVRLNNEIEEEKGLPEPKSPRFVTPWEGVWMTCFPLSMY